MGLNTRCQHQDLDLVQNTSSALRQSSACQPAVVIPLATQHYLLHQRNLVYTGVTRGKQLVVLVGQRKALAIAVRNNKTESRFSGLLARLSADGDFG